MKELELELIQRGFPRVYARSGKELSEFLTFYYVPELDAIVLNKNGSIIFFVGLTLPRYSFSKPSASLDRNLRQCLW